MSIKKLRCSLCCTSSNEYKELQNDVGESNDLYEITLKYFDPMLISVEGCSANTQKKVLCQNCWIHIKEFHEFQQNVIKTRTLLEKTEGNDQLIIKTESKIDIDDFSVKLETNKNFEDNFDNKDYPFQIGNIKYDMGFSDKHTTTSNEEDENPLITVKNSKPSDNKSDKINSSTRIGRKSKILASDDDKRLFKINGIQRKNGKQSGGDKTEKGNSKFNLRKARESDAFISEWKPILECDLCEETTSSFDKLRSHFRDKHKSRFYIKCCERKFYRRYVLVNHIQLHLNPNTYKCETCGKVSANKNNLKLHKKLMHEEIKQLECNVCHKLFNLKTSLDRHLLTHITGDKDFVCQECGKAYVLEVQLKSHIKTVHNVDRVCDQCGKTVHGIQALKKHLMEHAGIAKPKFPCEECGVKLNSRNGLKRHKAAYHHDGSTIYVCGICGKVAASESALLNHKKYVHEEERKHKCTYCDKAFKRPKNLLEHIATHTGQDLYQCPHCPQTFKVSANMHHHRKKVHPVEWEEGRKNRLQVPKVDINHVKNQVVL